MAKTRLVIDIDVSLDSVSVTPNNKQVYAVIEGLRIGDVLNEITIEEVIEHYGKDTLLDEIGEDKASKHFDLVKSED